MVWRIWINSSPVNQIFLLRDRWTQLRGFQPPFSLRNTRPFQHFWEIYLQSIGLVWLTGHKVFLQATDWHQKERPFGWITSSPTQSALLNQPNARAESGIGKTLSKKELFMRLWRSNLLPFEPDKTNIGETLVEQFTMIAVSMNFLKNIVNYPES